MNFPFKILGSKIPVNILPPYRPSKEDLLLRSVQGNQTEIHTMVEKPKLSKFYTVQYSLEQKDMAVFALQPLKNFNASHNGVLTGEGLSFELSQVDFIFMMMI